MVVTYDPNFWRYYVLEQLLEMFDEDSDKAEEIRIEMDELWWKLPKYQRLWFNRNVKLPTLP